jgi:large repetitive protein
VTMGAAGAGPTAMLISVSQLIINAVVDASIYTAPTGGGTYVTLLARHSGTTDYRLKEHFVLGGTLQLIITKVVSGTETALKTVNITGVTYTVGDVYRLRFVVSGSGTTTLTGKVWKVGATEPTAAQVSTTDADVKLQAAGSFGFQSYLSGSATAFPVVARYDNLSVTATQ